MRQFAPVEGHAGRVAGLCGQAAAEAEAAEGDARLASRIYRQQRPGALRRQHATASAREYVWPARHFALQLTGAYYPAMGQRFWLRADFEAVDVCSLRVDMDSGQTRGVPLRHYLSMLLKT